MQKKYYATIKKEFATLRNKLAQIPAKTAFEELDEIEKKVDNIMEYYEETHNDEISSKNESIDLFKNIYLGG